MRQRQGVGGGFKASYAVMQPVSATKRSASDNTASEPASEASLRRGRFIIKLSTLSQAHRWRVTSHGPATSGFMHLTASLTVDNITCVTLSDRQLRNVALRTVTIIHNHDGVHQWQHYTVCQLHRTILTGRCQSTSAAPSPAGLDSL